MKESQKADRHQKPEKKSKSPVPQNNKQEYCHCDKKLAHSMLRDRQLMDAKCYQQVALC